MGKTWTKEANRARQQRFVAARKARLAELAAAGLVEHVVVIPKGREADIDAAAAELVAEREASDAPHQTLDG